MREALSVYTMKGVGVKLGVQTKPAERRVLKSKLIGGRVQVTPCVSSPVQLLFL